jgi:galactokinase
VASASEIVTRFRAIYPSSGPEQIWRAPGRVNLIGEHTDYNQGLVLPMAIDLACFVATAPSRDGWMRVFSEQLSEGAQWRVQDIPDSVPRGRWDDRVLGVAWQLCRRGDAIQPSNIFISSTIPLGAGLSSSAALGVATALALGGPRSPLDLAKIAHTAETDFVGLPCGIMDHFASAHGHEGEAILLDCRSLQSRAVRLPEELAIVTANSMVRHELGESAYRIRVAECAEAAQKLGVASLRNVTCDQLGSLKGVLLKRARHVNSENARVEAFAAAASGGNAREMGRLVTESHASLRHDYEVSCAELDFLVETALTVPGVLGARMTGGGFGGSTVNLVLRSALNSIGEVLTSRYNSVFGHTPELHECVASAGASQVFF